MIKVEINYIFSPSICDIIVNYIIQISNSKPTEKKEFLKQEHPWDEKKSMHQIMGSGRDSVWSQITINRCSHSCDNHGRIQSLQVWDNILLKSILCRSPILCIFKLLLWIYLYYIYKISFESVMDTSSSLLEIVYLYIM